MLKSETNANRRVGRHSICFVHINALHEDIRCVQLIFPFLSSKEVQPSPSHPRRLPLILIFRHTIYIIEVKIMQRDRKLHSNRRFETFSFHFYDDRSIFDSNVRYEKLLFIILNERAQPFTTSLTQKLKT